MAAARINVDGWSRHSWSICPASAACASSPPHCLALAYPEFTRDV